MKTKRFKRRKTLRKSRPNFQQYVKKIEAQAKKNGFLLKIDAAKKFLNQAV